MLAYRSQSNEVDTSNFTPCSGSRYVASTKTTGDGIATYIQFVPKAGARGNWGNENSPVYGQMWSDLNRCAHFSSDISDSQRHSMYVQMACHARYGIVNHPRFGGNTWDLEAWRNDVSWDDGMSLAGSCGQRYGNVPGAGSHLRGRLVQSEPDPSQSEHRMSWKVDNLNGIYVRRHITTSRAYGCLVESGDPPARWYPAHFLDYYLPEGPTIGDEVCPTVDPRPWPTPTPTPSPSPLQPRRTVTVYNKVTNDAVSMREDDLPAYLSTVPQNYCKRDGCALPGTDMGTGAVITATCQRTGARTTNGWDSNPIDDHNPGLFESTRWYGIRWPDGRFGVLSEVWINPAHRGGLGLPVC